jgi:hypothetical protein
VPPEYGGITSPTFSVLSLRDNYLSGTLPSEWSRLHHLSQLYLDTNRLSGSIPSSYGGSGSGSGSGSRGSRRGDSGVGEDDSGVSTDNNTANQPYLQVLTLQRNTLTGTIPPGLTNGSNMCILLLNDNHLRGRLPPLSPALFRHNCTIYSGTQFSSHFRKVYDRPACAPTPPQTLPPTSVTTYLHNSMMCPSHTGSA